MIYRLFVSEIPAEQVVFYQHVSHAILHRLGNLWKNDHNEKLAACEHAYGFVLGFALAFARGVYELTPKWFRRSHSLKHYCSFRPEPDCDANCY